MHNSIKHPLNIYLLEYKVLSSEVKYVDATYNKLKGYSILVSLDIELNNIKGYISFYVDFFCVKDFKNIENTWNNETLFDIFSGIHII